jgi:hypothetical protein
LKGLQEGRGLAAGKEVRKRWKQLPGELARRARDDFALRPRI